MLDGRFGIPIGNPELPKPGDGGWLVVAEIDEAIHSGGAEGLATPLVQATNLERPATAANLRCNPAIMPRNRLDTKRRWDKLSTTRLRSVVAETTSSSRPSLSLPESRPGRNVSTATPSTRFRTNQSNRRTPNRGNRPASPCPGSTPPATDRATVHVVEDIGIESIACFPRTAFSHTSFDRAGRPGQVGELCSTYRGYCVGESRPRGTGFQPASQQPGNTGKMPALARIINGRIVT